MYTITWSDGEIVHIARTNTADDLLAVYYAVRAVIFNGLGDDWIALFYGDRSLDPENGLGPKHGDVRIYPNRK